MPKRAAAQADKLEYCGHQVSQTLSDYVDSDPAQEKWAKEMQPMKKRWKTTLLRAAVQRSKEVQGVLRWVVG